jgi:uncharacterized membrane protein
VSDLVITVASYGDREAAEADWRLMERGGWEGMYLSDAALLGKDEQGNVQVLERQSHHGWGKGAVIGAVVGVLFPPSLVAGAVVGAAGGGLAAHMNRSLDRGHLKELGDAMEAGDVSLVAVTPPDRVDALSTYLEGATKVVAGAGRLNAEELQKELDEG